MQDTLNKVCAATNVSVCITSCSISTKWLINCQQVVVTTQLATKLVKEDGSAGNFETGSKAILVPQPGSFVGHSFHLSEINPQPLGLTTRRKLVSPTGKIIQGHPRSTHQNHWVSVVPQLFIYTLRPTYTGLHLFVVPFSILRLLSAPVHLRSKNTNTSLDQDYKLVRRADHSQLHQCVIEKPFYIGQRSHRVTS